MARQVTNDDSTRRSNQSGLTFTRRTALALLGIGTLGSLATGSAGARNSSGDDIGNQPWYDWETDVDAQDHDLRSLNAIDVQHVYTSARDADVLVWKDGEGVFHADGRDGPVDSGDDIVEVTQAAVDSLSDGRTTKEKVLVASPGTVGPADELKTIDIPSYTILDVPATITVEDEGEPLVIPAYASNATEIEVPRLRVEGNPRFGLLFSSCSNVGLGDIWMDVSTFGVRIDKSADGRSGDVQVDQVYVENSGYHAFETNGVDRLQIGQVIGIEPDGAVVNMDDTSDATISNVVGKEPDVGGGYATLRVANYTRDVTVGQVVSRGGARGIFGVSGCRDITINGVNIVGAEDQGILIQDCQAFTVDSGTIRNCQNEAVRIDARTDEGIPEDPRDFATTSGVSISNIRIVDDRDEPQQTWGILETGPDTTHSRIVNNDVRGAGTEGNIEIYSPSTVVRNNIGDGINSGTIMLSSDSSPAARVEGVTEMERSSLETRAEPAEEGSDATYAWESYYEWNGNAGAWDLVFEWRTDPGTDLPVDYIVDKTR